MSQRRPSPSLGGRRSRSPGSRCPGCWGLLGACSQPTAAQLGGGADSATASPNGRTDHTNPCGRSPPRRSPAPALRARPRGAVASCLGGFGSARGGSGSRTYADRVLGSPSSRTPSATSRSRTRRGSGVGCPRPLARPKRRITMTSVSDPIKRLTLANPVEPGSLREVAAERADDLLAALRANQVATHPLRFSLRRRQVTSSARPVLIAVVVVVVALALVPIGGASLGSRAVDGLVSLWDTSPPDQPALDTAATDAEDIAGQYLT